MSGRNNVARSENSSATSEKVSYPTPPEILDLVREVLGEIDLDPCGNPSSIVGATCTIWLPEWSARVGLTEAEANELGIVIGDGLALDWGDPGTRVFDNPPYGLAHNKAWGRKNVAEAARGVEAIALVPSAPGTKWFRSYKPKRYGGESDSCCLWEGRIKFLGAPHLADFESALAYFGPRSENFRRVFEKRGWTT